MTIESIGRSETDHGTIPAVRPWRHSLSYLLFVVVPSLAVLLAVHATNGGHWVSSLIGSPARSLARPLNQVLAILLLAVAVIVVVTQVMGMVAGWLAQPRVVGEIAAGLLLGPSALGVLLPGVEATLFSHDVVFFLDALAQLGVIFFMFEVGRELPMSLLRGKGVTAIVVGHAGIAVPFLAGVLLALGPLAGYRAEHVPPVAFVVFCGIALSITAFPVLARILRDRGLRDTGIGALGMATAGASDVTAWCVLAVVIAVVRGQSALGALRTILLTVVFALVMWLVVRPLLARLAQRVELSGRHRGVVVIAVLCTLFCATAATEAIGVSAIFGAFLAGVVMPRNARSVEEFAYRLEGPTHWLMLPLFFAGTGLKTNLWVLHGNATWWPVVLVLVSAIAGKLLGITLPARLAGLAPRTALGLGVMMNCRGLTEIVVLQLGLTLGVISPTLFAVFLVMTLVTTAMTGPLLRWILPAPRWGS